jgi:hypothetical protein
MSADPTVALSDDRSRHFLTLTASGQPNDEGGPVVRISRRCSANLPPIREIRHRARGGPPRDRVRNFAPSISLRRPIIGGTGS